MLKLQGKLPREVYVACSGGVDSMAAVDFLRNNHDVILCYFNHGTSHGDKAAEFVARYATDNNLPLMFGMMNGGSKPQEQSWEEYWRKGRYNFLHSINGTVVTAHHLDDCVETWMWSSMHGTGKIVPYSNQNVIRPFRMTRKRDFQLWADLKNVPHIEDDSNADLCYTRNYIRHEMMPHVLRVNPGIHKTILKKVRDEHPT